MTEQDAFDTIRKYAKAMWDDGYDAGRAAAEQARKLNFEEFDAKLWEALATVKFGHPVPLKVFMDRDLEFLYQKVRELVRDIFKP